MYGLPDSFVGGSARRFISAIKPGSRRPYFYTNLLVQAIQRAEARALEEAIKKVRFQEQEDSE